MSIFEELCEQKWRTWITAGAPSRGWPVTDRGGGASLLPCKPAGVTGSKKIPIDSACGATSLRIPVWFKSCLFAAYVYTYIYIFFFFFWGGDEDVIIEQKINIAVKQTRRVIALYTRLNLFLHENVSSEFTTLYSFTPKLGRRSLLTVGIHTSRFPGMCACVLFTTISGTHIKKRWWAFRLWRASYAQFLTPSAVSLAIRSAYSFPTLYLSLLLPLLPFHHACWLAGTARYHSATRDERPFSWGTGTPPLLRRLVHGPLPSYSLASESMTEDQSSFKTTFFSSFFFFGNKLFFWHFCFVVLMTKVNKPLPS